MKRSLLSLILTGILLTGFYGYSAAGEYRKISEAQLKEALKHEIKANKLDDAGRLDEAIKEYEEALELNPYSVSCLFNLGLAYLKAGRNAEAIYTYERAIDLAPEDAELYKLLGIAFIKNGEREKAINAWEKSLALNPEQPRVKEFIEINR